MKQFPWAIQKIIIAAALILLIPVFLSLSYTCAAIIPVKSIKLDKNNVLLTVGKSISIKAAVSPAGASKNLTYVSSDKKVATVDRTGKIFGVTPGMAQVTVASASDKKVFARCIVIVTKAIIFTDYKEKSSGITLKIPKGWVVTRDKGTLYVRDTLNSATKVTFTFINNITNKINAVGVTDMLLKGLAAKYKDLKFTASLSKSYNYVGLNINYTLTGQKIKGKYETFLNNGNGLFCGYEAPEKIFNSQQGTLNYILMSLKMPSIPANVGKPAKTNDPNASVKLFVKSENGTEISVPEGWNVVTFGLPGNLLAADPDGNSGFVGQTVAVFPESLAAYANGNPVSGYAEPVKFLTDIYMPLLGNSNIKVVKEVDASQILQGAQGAEAKVALLTCNNAKGISLKTLILAITLSPSIVTGQWSALVYGFWTPEKQFESKYSLMTRISDSYKPNEEEIKRVTQENLKKYNEGINKLSQSLSSQLEASYTPSSQDGGISSEERLYQKWNDYAAGEERLYSAVEDKVYTLPSGFDKYNNPNYPSEELSPITNAQWGKEVDRSYLPGGWHN